MTRFESTSWSVSRFAAAFFQLVSCTELDAVEIPSKGVCSFKTSEFYTIPMTTRVRFFPPFELVAMRVCFQLISYLYTYKPVKRFNFDRSHVSS